MKLFTVIGARPQFIKAAPFSALFRQKNREILVHTGQHYDENMSDVFFTELSIPQPDYNLGIGSLSHGAQTGRMLEQIEALILEEKPDGLLVYGDTNSTLAGALAASKLHVPVFHVEAGLRSGNMRMPEEQNRILTDHISDLLLCPTETAVNNLNKEGLSVGVHKTGDIMYDAVLQNIKISKKKYGTGAWFSEIDTDLADKQRLTEKQYYLATIHRAENTDDPTCLAEIFNALRQLDKPVLMPLHPRTRKMISNLEISLENLIIIQPVGYLLMLYLTANARMVITDSGGLQKEAYFLGVPCTTLRDQTEWVETLENNWNILAPINTEKIIELAQRPGIQNIREKLNAFGDGNAAQSICAAITAFSN